MASSAAAAYEDDHIPTRERRKKTPQTLVPVHRCVQVKTLLYRHTARRGCIRQPLHHCQLSIQELVREMSAPSSRSISLYIAPSLSVFFSLSLSLPHKRINTIASNAPAWHVCYATAVRHAVSHWAHFIYPFFKQSSVFRQCPVEIWRHWQLTLSSSSHSMQCYYPGSGFCFFVFVFFSHRLKLGITFPCSKLGR